MTNTHSIIACLTMVVAAGTASAQTNWPSFRNAGTSVTTASAPPMQWSPGEGVAWRAEIPGYGQSAPVVWGDSIFVTSSDGPWQEDCFVHRFDLASGERRWSKNVKATTKVENYFRNSRAAPTCVVDANIVVSFFASGDVTAMDHDGNVIWTQSLFAKYGEVDNERGTATSPTQTDRLVILVIDHGGTSYIVAMQKSDGSIAWKTDRGIRVPSWSSPVVVDHQGRELVVISSSDTVEAYQAESGKAVWRVDDLAGNHIPSATVSGSSIYVGSTEMYHGTGDPKAVAGSNCRIDLHSGASGRPFAMRWSAERANSYYSSPLPFAGFVYYVNKAGVLYCVDQETGEQVYAKRIGNPCWASAIGVTTTNGEHFVYFVTKNGFTIILRPGNSYDQVARNQLWDAEEMMAAAATASASRRANRVPPEQAVPKTGPEQVFAGMPESSLHRMFSYGDPTVYAASMAGNRLLIRTGQHLYCVTGVQEDPPVAERD